MNNVLTKNNLYCERNSYSFKLNDLTFIFFFGINLIYPFLNTFLGSMISDWICIGIFFSLLLLTFLIEKNSFKIDMLLIPLFVLLVFYITSLVHPEYANLIFTNDATSIFNTIFVYNTGIAYYVILRLEDNPNRLLNKLFYAAFIVWISFTIRSGLSYFGIVTTLSSDGDNHAYGYAFLFSMIMFFYRFKATKKFSNLIIFIISLVQIVLYGSRTAFISAILFALLYMLFLEKKRKFRNKAFIISFLSIIVLILTSDYFAKLIYGFLISIGFQSRTLDLFISGDGITLDGGRLEMYEQAISFLKSNFWGLGIYWDRYYVRFTYVHNIVFEMLLDFGWILGTIILMLLVISSCKMFVSRNENWKKIFILFFCLTFIRLTLSYSFWIDSNFWALIAIFVSFFSFKKIRGDSSNA